MSDTLFDFPYDKNITDYEGQTVLFSAVLNNNESGVRALIKAGADVNKTDNEGTTALFYAVIKKNENMVKILIDAGAEVNISDNVINKTALSYTFLNDKENITCKLIAAGADVNKTDNEGKTALLYAVENGNECVLRALIEAGADVNTNDHRGITPLCYSVLHNGNPNIPNILIDALADVNKSDEEGRTPLCCAVLTGKGNMVVKLLDAGADVNTIDVEGKTALFYAMTSITYEERVAHALIEAGTDLNITDNKGKSVLFYVIQSDKENMVRALIAAGADVNVTDNQGNTSLVFAVLKGNESVVRALIDSGADVNIKDNSRNTALHYAVSKNNEGVAGSSDYPARSIRIVRILVERGNAQVNAKDQYGRTPLFYALTQSIPTARYLLEKGGNINLKDNFNMSISSFFVDDLFSSKSGLASTCHRVPKELSFLKKQVRKPNEIFQAVIDTVFRKTFHLTSYFYDIDGQSLDLGLGIALHLVARFSMKENRSIQKILRIIRDEATSGIRLIESPVLKKILYLLIQLGANPNSVDSGGNTALHYATRLPFYCVSQETVIGLCQQLETFGASFNVKNHRNEIPLMYTLSKEIISGFAFENHQWSGIKIMMKVCHFLVQHGSSVEETTRNGEYIFHLTFRVLQHVCLKHSSELKENVVSAVVKLFELVLCVQMTKGVAVNIRDADLNSPVHLWASLELMPNPYSTTIEGQGEFDELLKATFKILVENDAQLSATNINNETPLHLCRTWTAVKLLIGAGANPNVIDSAGRSPLLVAARKKTFTKNMGSFYSDVLQEPKQFWKTALELGLDPWKVDKHGESVLSILIESEAFVLSKAIVEVASKDNHLQSDTIAISFLNSLCKDSSASAHWKSYLVELILKSRINSSFLENSGDDALHLCCRNVIKTWREVAVNENVHLTIAKQLLSHGADCRVPDATGHSCLDKSQSCPVLKDLLLKPVYEFPLLIPWISVSKVHESLLGKVARRQESKHVEPYWYHKNHLQSGSFGFVFAGINEKDGREVAIKRIEKLRMHKTKDKREITNLTALADCEQVVRYLSFFEDEHFCYVVLELLEGNLEEYLSGAFEKSKAIQLCKDVVSGVKYLHDQNILHRDLKPSNILYKTHPKLCLKIADFGLSRRIDSSSTGSSINVGTKCWIAPEILKSEHPHSKLSDIFASGLILHYIVSLKKHPFSPSCCANTIVENNILNGKMEGWDHSLRPEATHLLIRMLEDDKSRRPSAAEALEHPFFWSKKKTIGLLVAVGNQKPEFACPRAKRSPPLSSVEMDLEANFGNIVRFPKWDDPGNVHMPTIYTEMTKRRPPYDTFSVVELVRFIRNSYAHVTEISQPNLLLEDFVFLEYFPNLVIDVYKAVTIYGWDQTRDEIISVIKN